MSHRTIAPQKQERDYWRDKFKDGRKENKQLKKTIGDLQEVISEIYEDATIIVSKETNEISESRSESSIDSESSGTHKHLIKEDSNELLDNNINDYPKLVNLLNNSINLD